MRWHLIQLNRLNNRQFIILTAYSLVKILNYLRVNEISFIWICRKESVCVYTPIPRPHIIVEHSFFICTIGTSRNTLSSQGLTIPTTSHVQWCFFLSWTGCMYEPACTCAVCMSGHIVKRKNRHISIMSSLWLTKLSPSLIENTFKSTKNGSNFRIHPKVVDFSFSLKRTFRNCVN